MNVVHENIQNRLNSAIVYARGEIRVTERETHAIFVGFFPGGFDNICQWILADNTRCGMLPPLFSNPMNIEVRKHVG